MTPASRPGALRRALDGLYVGAAVVAAACIVLMFVMMMVQAVGREIGFQLRGAVELTSWSNAATAFLGLAYTFKHGDVIRVGLLLEKLDGRLRWLAELACLGVATAFVGYAVYAAIDFVAGSYRMHDMTDGLLVIPLWIPQVSVVVGLAILFIAVVDELVLVACGNTPTYEKAARERAASGEFGEET
jgi:TRAP-type C4-dicarboxylate transport system permease small subunit